MKKNEEKPLFAIVCHAEYVQTSAAIEIQFNDNTDDSLSMCQIIWAQLSYCKLENIRRRPNRLH